jgi:hypothetical protein
MQVDTKHGVEDFAECLEERMRDMRFLAPKFALTEPVRFTVPVTLKSR